MAAKKSPQCRLETEEMEMLVLGRQADFTSPPPHPEVEETGLILEGAATDGSGWIRFGVTIILLIVKRLCPAASAVGRSF